MGFSPHILKWIESYLCDRSIRVVFNNALSNSFQATSGVPQGSHLGPLFFILFVNDLFSVILYSFILGFADDFKIFKKIMSVLDCMLLQDDLNRFYVWCNKNGMSLNPAKCVVITFNRKLSCLTHEYLVNGNILSKCDKVLDLGVTMDSKLDFRAHVNNVERLGLLRMCTLEKRREVTGVLFIYQLLSGSIDSPNLLKLVNINSRPRTLRNNEFLYLNTHRTNYGLHKPMSTMSSLFNISTDNIDFNLNKLQIKKLLYTEFKIS